MPAIGYWTVAMKEMQDRGVLEENLESEGYALDELLYTWDGPPLWLAGQVDLSHLTPDELSLIAKEEGLQTVVSGRIVTNFTGWWTRPGSPYDPDEAGGLEAAIQKISEDQAIVATGGWGGGSTPPTKVLMSEFGYEWSQDSDDFNVVTGQPTATPQLVANGDADITDGSPMHGGADLILNDELKPVFQFPPVFQERFGFIPGLNNVTVTREVYDEHPGMVKAFVDTWAEGNQYLYEAGADAIRDQTDLNDLGVGSMEAANYVMEWGIGNPDVPYSFESPAIWEDAYMDDEYIEATTTFLDSIAGDDIPSDWGDFVDFEKVQ
jgi:ABC-type nitrate/sulfonate/bicarbonate transport system substrate-binding protein